MFNQKFLLGFALAFAVLAAVFLSVPESGSLQYLQNPMENKAAKAFFLLTLDGPFSVVGICN